MTNIWVVSDQHFGHANILKFTDGDGLPIRPGFSCVEDMDDFMIQQHNAVVRPDDHVWFLGDVALCAPHYADYILSQLNGKKRLLFGNHDKMKLSFYQKHFQKIWPCWRRFDNNQCSMIFTHVPIHAGSLFQKDKNKPIANVHGHIHQNKIDDPRYINVCVEHTGYAPVHLDELIAKVAS